MKLPKGTHHTEVIGESFSRKAQISSESTSFIISMLRDMYKNPLKACIQEILSNARDAHREIGKENLPIEVSLPTSISPAFKVKDYGPGISPERMRVIFLNVGSSTKREDNVETGGFGIGSKSPLAYTSSFSLVTVVDGVKYSYAVHLDEDDEITVSLMMKSETEEPNGTEISIPIKTGDFKNAHAHAKSICFFWEVVPHGVAVEGRDEWVKTEYGFLLDKDDHGYMRNTILIDGIPYEASLPIENNPKASKIRSEFMLSSCYRSNTGSRQARFVPSFRTGELQVVPSREGVKDSEKNRATYAQKLSDYYDFLDKVYIELARRASNLSGPDLIKFRLTAIERSSLMLEGILVGSIFPFRVIERANGDYNFLPAALYKESYTFEIRQNKNKVKSITTLSSYSFNLVWATPSSPLTDPKVRKKIKTFMIERDLPNLTIVLSENGVIEGVCKNGDKVLWTLKDFDIHKLDLSIEEKAKKKRGGAKGRVVSRRSVRVLIGKEDLVENTRNSFLQKYTKPETIHLSKDKHIIVPWDSLPGLGSTEHLLFYKEVQQRTDKQLIFSFSAASYYSIVEKLKIPTAEDVIEQTVAELFDHYNEMTSDLTKRLKNSGGKDRMRGTLAWLDVRLKNMLDSLCYNGSDGFESYQKKQTIYREKWKKLDNLMKEIPFDLRKDRGLVGKGIFFFEKTRWTFLDAEAYLLYTELSKADPIIFPMLPDISSIAHHCHNIFIFVSNTRVAFSEGKNTTLVINRLFKGMNQK